MKTIPKIRGYIANKNHKIVFLYRQSNKITYLVLLNYQKKQESIQIGSRFYGRIYPNRCDIAPDGTYFLYFAMGSSQQQYQKRLYCWTGICTPPYIKAELLFAHNDTWGGGGRFIDEQTLLISRGMYPQFDLEQNYTIGKYQITLTGKYDSWTSGQGWKLIETQIDSRYGQRYPIPKCWVKSNGKITLLKYLNYSSFLKSKNGQTVGSYDLHSYEVQNNKTKVRHFLNQENTACLWADFDNYGRLVLARGSEVFIYNNWHDITNHKFKSKFNIEQLLR